MGSSALVSVVTGLVEVVGSLERSCPVCGAGSAGLAAGVGGSVAGFLLFSLGKRLHFQVKKYHFRSYQSQLLYQ